MSAAEKRKSGVSQLLMIAAAIAAIPGTAWTAEEAAQGGAVAAQVAQAVSPAERATQSRIEEVVITARKAEESQQVVPVSVTALSDAALKAAAVISVYDLAASVPGLYVGTNSQGGAPTFAIRAAKADNGTSDTVTAYVDDVPMASTIPIANMTYDMASISTLKGPQGTFFGTSTTGGAIIFRPNKPSEVFEGYVELGVGNWGRKTFEGMVNLPINDVLQVRFAGDMVRRDGFVTNHTPANGNGNMNDRDHRSARLSIRLKPSTDLMNDLVINHFHEDRMPDQEVLVALRDRYNYRVSPSLGGFLVPVDYVLAGITKPDGTRDVAIGPHPTWHKAENIDFGNTTTYEVNENVSLKNVIGFQNFKTDASMDNDTTVYPGVNVRTVTRIEQWTEEFSVDTKFWDGRMRNKSGLFYSNRKIDNYVSARVIGLPFDTTGLAPGQVFVVNNFFPVGVNRMTGREFESKAIYTQFAYDITDSLTATLGARYTWDEGEYETTNRLAFIGTTGLGPYGDYSFGMCNAAGLATYKNFDPARCIAFQDFKTSAPSYTFTLENKFSDRQMAYATIRHGYLIGGFNNDVYTPDRSGQIFLPEEVTDTEFGLKSDWDLMGRPIRTNVALFFGHYKNQQRVQNGTTTLGTAYISVQNAGASTFYGWDLDVIYDVTDWLRLTLGWNHVTATYDNFKAPLNVPNATPLPFIDMQGQQLAQTPKDVVSLSATFTWPLATDMGKLSSTLSYYWRDDTTHHDSPTFNCVFSASGECTSVTEDFSKYDRLEDYSIVNFTTEWKNVMGSPIDVRFWVKNLFDKTYAAYGSNQMLQFGYATYLYGAPREYGLNVRYNF